MTTRVRPTLLHVISGLRRGGAEHALVRLAEHGLAQAFDMHVLSLEDEGVFGARLRAAGASVHAINLRRFPMGAPGRLVKLVRAIRPSVVQGWMYHGNIAALIAASITGSDTPLFWNVRQGLDDIASEKRLTRATIRLNRWWSGRPVHILYNSQRSRSQHEAFGFCATRSQVIPNGFDLRHFARDPSARARLRGALGISDTATLVGHFARLHPMKDHAGLLQAANLALGRNRDIHFLMAGQGVSAKAAGLATHVDRRFHGNIHIFNDRSDIPDLMQAIDLYVSSSSRGEGFPNVIGEAMASSRPCLGTDVGDTAAIIGDCGIVVPPGDPDALAEGIVALARDPARRDRLGKAARRKIRMQFDIDKVAGQYIALYATALPNWRG